jgi:hypothetical protein
VLDMAERETAKPTHRVYTVIRREGQDDYWLNIGLAFPHKDGSGFNIVLQALPLDGKIVCRETTDDDQGDAPQQRGRQDAQRGRRR